MLFKTMLHSYTHMPTQRPHTHTHPPNQLSLLMIQVNDINRYKLIPGIDAIAMVKHD